MILVKLKPGSVKHGREEEVVANDIDKKDLKWFPVYPPPSEGPLLHGKRVNFFCLSIFWDLHRVDIPEYM